MKTKKLVPLIALAAVVAILGISLAFLKAGGEEETETGVALTDLDAGAVTAIAYTKTEDELSVALSRPATGEDAQWTLDGNPELPLDQGKVSAIATDLAGLKAVRELTDVTDTDGMGFDEPTMSFTLSGTDGASLGLTVGAKNDMTDAYYVKVDGKNSVYTVSTSDLASMCKTEKDLYAAQAMTDITTDDAVSMTLQTTGEELRFTKTDDTWTLDGDPEYALDQDVVSRMAQTVCDLKSTWSITNPEADSLYGLDAPSAVVTLRTADGKTVTCSFGTTDPVDSTACFMRCSSAPGVVYEVAADNLSAYAYTKSTLKAATPESAETAEAAADYPVS